MVERSDNLVRLGRIQCGVLLCLVLLMFVYAPAHAQPVTFLESHAGNLNYQVTGGTLRTASNSSNPCSVTSSGSAPLAGIPVTATIQRAYLYWAGSGPTADNQVTFQGSTINASRTFAATFGPYQFFSGFADVTSLVTGNGIYTFSNLTVTNTNLPGAPYCTVQAVLSGWGLAVIYQDAGEPLRVLNLYDGFEVFRNSSLAFNPSNFQIPGSGIDGKFGALTWEGDPFIPAPVNETLAFNGNDLWEPIINPQNAVHNSTINVIPTQTSYGVDFDVFDVTPYLSPGDTSATTFYATSNDLVILSLELLAVTNTPVADLAISKSHSGDFIAGQQGVYTIGVSNNGPNNETNTITVSDTLPAGLSYVSAVGSGWACAAVGQVVTCTHAGPLASGNSLPNIALTVNVNASAAPSVTNTATVSSATFDNVAANNTANDLTNVLVPDLSTSTKTVLDLNGGDANPGDTLRYTITVIETGGVAVSGVSITDVIDTLLANFIVTNDGGGNDTSTPGSGPLNISALSVAANGSVTIQFEADIVGTANPGDIISNTAVINNPVTGGSTNAVAPNVIVSASSIPGSGIKQLYFNAVLGSQNNPTLPQTMSRVPLTAPSVPPRIRLRRQDTPRRWDLTPSLQASLNLSTAAIPVVLQMRRSGNTSTRNLRVTLDYVGGATGFIGCLDLAIPGTGPGSLSNTLTLAFTFNVVQSDAACNPIAPAPIALPAATVIRATLDNQVGGPGTGRAVFIYPFNNDTPDTSRVELPATTVINVDSVPIVDDVAYPGGSAQPSYVPGEILRVRAVVSDPFGHDDITGATIEILDPTATPTVPAGTAMTEVAPLAPGSPGSIKTFEYVYTLPGAGPNGNWTANITANEGSEGAISDLGVNTFLVGTPAIMVTKLVSTISDSVNNPSYPDPDVGANPKAIPSAIMEYRILVSNSGAGRTDVDSLVITDPLASGLIQYFNNPIDPVQFIDGTPSSGLTFTFNNLADPTDDVDFSNDGGTTFITPTVDANGFDITVPFINFIRIAPKGRLNGNIGSGNPNFTIIFKARVQ